MSEETPILDIAAMLWDAQFSGATCPQPSVLRPSLNVEDAYAIQEINIARRRSSRGLHGKLANPVGRKIGLTSKAIQSWLNVHEPDFGVLLDDMLIPDGESADVSNLLQPRAEGEIAFVLGRDLGGPGVTGAEVIAATDFLLPAIEIIDSRIEDWKITYEDTIADNASSGMFVLGNQPVSLRNTELRLCGMVLRKNGAVVSTGAGAACLGHPINAVVWLANKLAEFGEKLEAGDIVLSGALGPVTPVEAGDHLEAEIRGVGRVTVGFR
ncbi:MAG: 2-keto-4-pentenoate hydratase [Bradymonadaceae bacterium]